MLGAVFDSNWINLVTSEGGLMKNEERALPRKGMFYYGIAED